MSRIDAFVPRDRVERVAGLLHADRDVAALVLLREVEERTLLVVAVHQEDLADGAHETEERTLQEVGDLAVGVVDRADAFDREVVADADMEIRLIGRGRDERAGVEVRVAGLRTFRMRVTLNREDEGRPGGLLRGEAGFGALRVVALAGLTVIETVEVFRVGRESIDDDFRRLAGGQLGDGRLAGVFALSRADLKERFHRGGGDEAGRDGLIGRAAEDQGDLGKFREGFREHVFALEDRAAGLGGVIAAALAAFAAALPLLLLGGDGGQERPAEGGGHEADELAAHHLAEGRFIEWVGFSSGGVFGAHGMKLRRLNAGEEQKLRWRVRKIFRKLRA